MNKSELIAAISEKADIKKVDVEKFFGAFIETVSEELKEGNKIQLVGFGTFREHLKELQELVKPTDRC